MLKKSLLESSLHNHKLNVPRLLGNEYDVDGDGFSYVVIDMYLI